MCKCIEESMIRFREGSIIKWIYFINAKNTPID
jgi:hypothetical protein